jgi:TatD DNase family protein
MPMLIDTHCHLDYLKLNLDELLVQCHNVGVKKLISISVDEANMKLVFDLIQKHSSVYGTLGIHPHEAKTWNHSIEDFMRTYYSHPKIVGFGEFGLDYYYMHSTKAEQRQVFEKQLELAAEFQMPIVIHSREAEQDTMDVIRPFLPKLPSVVFHSFSSSLPLAEFAIEHNCYLGFTGMITFKNADNIRAALALAPLNKIVVETDAPFLAPVPHRGKENTSVFLPFIAQKIAELKNIPLDELQKILWQNTLKLFPKIAH